MMLVMSISSNFVVEKKRVTDYSNLNRNSIKNKKYKKL